MQSISSMEEEDGRKGQETCSICQPVDFDLRHIIKSPQNQQRTKRKPAVLVVMRKRRLDNESLTNATPVILNEKYLTAQKPGRYFFMGKQMV
jgi:hypothetical protein